MVEAVIGKIDVLSVPEIEHPKKHALLKVWDARGIGDFARDLYGIGFDITATRETAARLKNTDIPVEEIDDEMSFGTSAGILYDRKNPNYLQEVESFGGKPFDILACNFQPFPLLPNGLSVDKAEILKNMDITAIVWLSAAAKNHQNVLPIMDPQDYSRVIEALRNGQDSNLFRQELMLKVFRYLQLYDSVMATSLRRSYRNK